MTQGTLRRSVTIVSLFGLVVVATAALAAPPQNQVQRGPGNFGPATRTERLLRPLFPTPTFTVGWTPQSFVVADLDGDMDEDVAVANFEGTAFERISVLLSNGVGGFAPAVGYSTGGTGAISIASGDLDGDADPDLAVANFNSSRVSVLLNNGDGTFAAATVLPSDVKASAVAIGDLDGDMDQDLAVAVNNVLSGTYRLAVILNNGNATFAAPILYLTGSTQPEDVAICDLDGDADQDIVLALSSRVSVFVNDGSAAFTLTTYTGGSSSLAIGDLDGDLDPDLVTTVSTNVGVRLNNGDGTFGAVQSYAAGGTSQSAAIGDLDGDLDVDLAVALPSEDNVAVLRGNGDGTFGTATEYASGGGLPWDIAIVKQGRDRHLDVLVANADSRHLACLLNEGNGTFVAANRYPAISGHVLSRDFNGDSHPDVMVGTYISGYYFHLYPNAGDGSFGPASQTPSGLNSVDAIAAGDLDGDTDLDVAFAGYSDDRITVLFNNGDGTFGLPAFYGTVGGDRPRSVGISDLDGDGDADVVAGESMGTLSVYLNQGSGLLSGPFVYGTADSSGGAGRVAAIGDVDGDTDMDVVVTYFGTFEVFLNQGNATFAPEVVYSFTSGGAEPFVLGDVNGDAAPDLVVTIHSGHAIRVLRNLGNGTFAASVTYPAGKFPDSIALRDLDGNGDPDLAVGSEYSDTVTVLLGAGDGSFGPPHGYGGGGTVMSFDADSDTDYDLIALNHDEPNFCVLMNRLIE